jgi:hypothetical protein
MRGGGYEMERSRGEGRLFPPEILHFLVHTDLYKLSEIPELFV